MRVIAEKQNSGGGCAVLWSVVLLVVWWSQRGVAAGLGVAWFRSTGA